MSSPRLNNVIVVGCIMTYFSVILFGLDGGLISTEQYGKVCIVSNSGIYMPLCQAIEPIRVQQCLWAGISSNHSVTHFIVEAFSKILYIFFIYGFNRYRNIWRFIFILKEPSHVCFPSLLGSCLDHVHWFYSGLWRNVREDVASARNL